MVNNELCICVYMCVYVCVCVCVCFSSHLVSRRVDSQPLDHPPLKLFSTNKLHSTQDWKTSILPNLREAALRS